MIREDVAKKGQRMSVWSGPEMLRLQAVSNAMHSKLAWTLCSWGQRTSCGPASGWLSAEEHRRDRNHAESYKDSRNPGSTRDPWEPRQRQKRCLRTLLKMCTIRKKREKQQKWKLTEFCVKLREGFRQSTRSRD